jgi:tetratricopeptide (TPR) repeat protein
MCDRLQSVSLRLFFNAARLRHSRLLTLLVMSVAVAYSQPHPAMLRQLYQQNLTSQQRQYGEFDEHTAGAARDLGLFLRTYGDTDGARDALSRLVAIDEKVFGAAAPRTLSDVADLASVSPPDVAVELFERAAKSSDAAAAARALVALGEMQASQGDREGAAKYWRQALASQEAADPDSASMATILNVLAQTVPAADAIPLLRRALALDRKLLGPAHPEVGAVDQLLAGSLLAVGKAAEAVAPGREALSILETKLGPGHPRTARAASTLADVLRSTGQFAEAERLYRQALSIDEEVLGLQNPSTQDDIRALAQLLRRRGKVAEASQLERRLIMNVAQ